MSLEISPTDDALYTVLRAFLLGIVADGVEVIRGQGNQVPEPQGTTYVLMQASFRDRLSTNIETDVDPSPDPAPGSTLLEEHAQVDIQVDVYGPGSADISQKISAVWRSDYACAALAPTCQPLYADQARQTSFVNGEQQFEERWTVTCSLQYNPVVSTPQQFMDGATVTLINVDEAYPP